MAKNVVEYVLRINADKGSAELKKVSKDLKKTQKDLDKTGKKGKSSMKKLALGAKKAKTAMMALRSGLTLVGVASAAAGAGFFALAKQQADYINSIADTSARTGIAIRNLAGLKLAAESSGIAFSSIETSLNGFIPKLTEAMEKTSRTRKFFDALGVSVDDNSGKMRNTNDVFEDTIAKLGSITDKATQSAFAYQIFGQEAGAALIQSGALSNLEEFKKRAEEIGPALDEGAIKKAAEFQKGWADLKTSVLGSIGKLIQGLMGEQSLGLAMSKLADHAVNLGSGISIFIDDLKNAFAGAKIFLDDLKETISDIAESSPIGSYFGTTSTLAKGFQNQIMVHHKGAPDVKGSEEYAPGEVVQPSYRDMHDRTKALNKNYARNVGKWIARNYESMDEFMIAVKADVEDAKEAGKDIARLIKAGIIEPGYFQKIVPEMHATFEKAKKDQDAVTKKALEMQKETAKERKNVQKLKEFKPMLPGVTDAADEAAAAAEKIESAWTPLDFIKPELFDIPTDGLIDAIDIFTEVDDRWKKLVDDIDSGSITMEDAGIEANTLRKEFEKVGYTTEDIDQLILKIDELKKQTDEAAQSAKKLAQIEYGTDIARQIVDLAGGNVMGGISNLANMATQAGAISGPAGAAIAGGASILTGLESLGRELVAAEDEALEKHISNLIEKQEIRMGRKLSDEEIKAIENGISSAEVKRIKAEGREEMIRARMENMTKFISLAISELPIILMEVLPPMLLKLSANIVQALFMLPGKILGAFASGVVDWFKMLGEILKDAFTGAPAAVAEDFGLGVKKAADAIATGFHLITGGIFNDSKRKGGRFISARSGIRYTGMRDGLAMLHRNEFVVPESGARPQAINRIMNEGGRGGISININSEIVERNAIDELIKRIERRFQSFGTSESTLFG